MMPDPQHKDLIRLDLIENNVVAEKKASDIATILSAHMRRIRNEV